MTARQLRRRVSAHPIMAAVVVGVVLVLLIRAPWLLAPAAATVVGYAAGRRSLPSTLAAERVRAAAAVADLERQLSDARASAELAWDAAAGREPASRPGDGSDRRTALLSDARSGARPLLPS